MSEVKAIEVVDNALAALAPDERARVLYWAQSKYGVITPESAPQVTPKAVEHHTPHQPSGPSATGPKAKGKGSKKAKTVISMDKTLNLSPSGKISAVDFATAKEPTNVMQKCVVAAYYLRETIGLQKVGAVSVFTFFKHLSWPIPADLKNTLQQAGTVGWLDTADSEDIKITSLGENLVEHTLPQKAKSK